MGVCRWHTPMGVSRQTVVRLIVCLPTNTP